MPLPLPWPTGLSGAALAVALASTAWLVYDIFGRGYRHTVYWFLMQLGMTIGFFTAWPVNSWLIRKGIKEAMYVRSARRRGEA